MGFLFLWPSLCQNSSSGIFSVPTANKQHWSPSSDTLTIPNNLLTVQQIHPQMELGKTTSQYSTHSSHTHLALISPTLSQSQHSRTTSSSTVLMNNQKAYLGRKRIEETIQWSSSMIHCCVWNVPFERSSTRRFSSLFAPGPGLKMSASPHTTQVSLDSPRHHPPGTTLPGPRPRTSLSMRSSTGSFRWNREAKADPLFIMSSKSESFRCLGSSFEDV